MPVLYLDIYIFDVSQPTENVHGDCLSPCTALLNYDETCPDAPSSDILDVPLSVNPDEVDLSSATFASKCKKRGRPRGACTTAIGLPKAKKLKINKPTPFHMLDVQSKQKRILGWIVDVESVHAAFHLRRTLSEENLILEPDNIPGQIKDSSVDINVLRRFFDSDGWAAVEVLVEGCLSIPWKCESCRMLLSDSESIGCDMCLEWNHLKCINLKKPPKSKYWYCTNCK